MGDVEQGLPSPLIDESDIRFNITGRADIISRWNRRERLIKQFWVDWRSQYVSSLLSRDKWHKSSRPLTVGELVLVHMDNKKVHQYPLAVVTEAIASKDGFVHTYTVRLANGKHLRRDTNKLARLEVDQSYLFETQDDVPRPCEPHGLSRLLPEIDTPVTDDECEISDDDEAEASENDVSTESKPKQVRTRSGRISKKPSRYVDT